MLNSLQSSHTVYILLSSSACCVTNRHHSPPPPTPATLTKDSLSRYFKTGYGGKLGLVWRNRKKISQIINDYLYLPFFLLFILCLPSSTLSRQAQRCALPVFDAVHFESPMCVYSTLAALLRTDVEIADFCHRKRAAWLHPTTPPISNVLTTMCSPYVLWPKESLKNSFSKF